MSGLARQIGAALVQNLGTSKLGAYLDLTGKISTEGLGPISQMADNELTKISPGEVTLSVADHDDSVWTWILANASSEGGLFPFFLILWVGSSKVFTGTVDPWKITRDQVSRSLSISSQDWSVLLASNYLDTWTRPKAKTHGNPNATAVSHTGYAPEVASTTDPRYQMPAMNVVTFAAPNNWLAVGDVLTSSLVGGSFKVVSISDTTVTTSNNFVRQIPTPNFTATLDGNPWLPVNQYTNWDSYACEQATFTRQAAPDEIRDYYSVSAKVTANSSAPTYRLPLDTVDGIVPGDSLQLALGQKQTTWTVLQVDPDLNHVITREEMPDLVIGDIVQFTDQSVSEVVFEDARQALRRAASPYGVDFSRFTATQLPSPTLCWLPLRPGITASEDLLAVRDVDTGLSTLRVFGSGSASWDGDPEDGWATSTTPGARAVWTSQLLSAPASLMPWEVPALVPTAPRRNRFYDPRWRAWTDLSTADPLNASWDPVGAATPAGIVVYDYAGMRRVKIVGSAVTTNAWTGTAWGSDVTATWPGGASPLSANVLPGAAGAVVALLPSGLQLAHFPSGSTSAVLGIPSLASDGVLVTTPWGLYLVGSLGYGLITWNGTALAMDWKAIGDTQTTLIPSTFCAMNPEEVFVMIRFDVTDRQGNKSTETRALRLVAVPSSADIQELWNEKIMEGSPITAGAVRCPTGTRIIGHAGGRLFQVASYLPVSYALERFTPSGMTSSELIEHICQVVQAVAYPDSQGVLHVISRSLTETPININVDQVSIVDTRVWENFFSVVRVSGQGGDDVYADAYGAIAGGDLLEVSSHPLLWTACGCAAVAEGAVDWFGTPRRLQVQHWFQSDASAGGPWEGLPPLPRITINGGTQVWIVLGISDDKVKGEAEATLLEVV